jgi:hypothetical protein
LSQWNSAAGDASFAGDEVVSFGFGVGLDRGQVRASLRHLPRLHFDFSERKTSIEFDDAIAQRSRLGDNGSQFFACRYPDRRIGSVFFCGLDAGGSDCSSPADFRILALGREGPCMLHRFFCWRSFTPYEQSAGKDAPSRGLVVAGFFFLKNGTEYVRANLLPSADAARVHELLMQYLDQSILFYTVRDATQLQHIGSATDQIQNELWSVVQARAETQPNAIVGLAVSGMNDVLNSQGYT